MSARVETIEHRTMGTSQHPSGASDALPKAEDDTFTELDLTLTVMTVAATLFAILAVLGDDKPRAIIAIMIAAIDGMALAASRRGHRFAAKIIAGGSTILGSFGATVVLQSSLADLIYFPCAALPFVLFPRRQSPWAWGFSLAALALLIVFNLLWGEFGIEGPPPNPVLDLAVTCLAVLFFLFVLFQLHRTNGAREKQLAETVAELEAEVERRRRVESDLLATSELAKSSSQAKTRFLANMSHEIRTPLSAVISLTEIVLRSELTEEQRCHLDLSKESAEHLLGVIGDILELSKIEAGQLEFNDQPVSLRKVIAQAIAIVQPAALAKNLPLRTRADAKSIGWIAVDALRIRQVLVNLLHNAIKFTEQGDVTLSVQRVGETLVFEVRDTGIGIRTLDRTELFKPFVQTHEVKNRWYGGTGLGLAISKSIVEHYGGTFSVESAYGLGTTIAFSLPLPFIAAPANSPATGNMTLDGLAGLRVLLAEDNPVNQLVARKLLGSLGMMVQVACDGREAVSQWSAGQFDVVLMDVQMPVLDGIAATREIRALEQREQRPHTPIIAVTANVLREDLEKCLVAGMDGYLTKPIRTPQLLELCSRYVAPRLAASSSDQVPIPHVVGRWER